MPTAKPKKRKPGNRTGKLVQTQFPLYLIMRLNAYIDKHPLQPPRTSIILAAVEQFLDREEKK